MVLKSKLARLLSPARCLWSVRGGLSSSRNLAKFSPTFPDPPCQPPDLLCHYVKDKCTPSRDILELELPFDKHMLDLERLKREKLLEPPCCVLRTAHQHPCVGVYPIRKKMKKEECPPFRSMWEIQCQTHEQRYCKGMLPRFDEIYYKPSVKCRCYQRTWVECPPVKERLKKVCCLDGISPPEVHKRNKERCPQTTCMFDYSRMRHICKNRGAESVYRCPKIHWPCCKPARCNNSCRVHKRLSKCRRLRTPYPCFSEQRPRYQPLRARQCHEEPISRCEIWRMLHKRELSGLKNFYC
ncbi:uncharacterized protein LOC115764405 [Drosophila novamexicana]|uniref:uncharacterized protein LOC115764405 n=1 Tax=Drosophila novamexicana TaxID=47314 RepID=UPI0011E5EB1F|nr:uncharacterized protein LOC115764405 [Drosophila novamexicana]